MRCVQADKSGVINMIQKYPQMYHFMKISKNAEIMIICKWGGGAMKCQKSLKAEINKTANQARPPAHLDAVIMEYIRMFLLNPNKTKSGNTECNQTRADGF